MASQSHVCPKTSKILFAALLAFVGGCASNELKNSENPEVVYKEGLRLLEDEDYLEAADFLDEVRRRFPQSRFAALAELKSADLEFRQDNFIEAAAAYGVFVELYPTHAESPYALYQRAISYYNSAPDNIARDQSSAGDAARVSQQLIARYPQSAFVDKARALYVKSRLKLAKKEAYVARFYEKKEHYEPALRRWKALLDEFPDLEKGDDGKGLRAEAKDRVAALQKELKL
jgi:outer membrane protein assembly factor BamD